MWIISFLRRQHRFSATDYKQISFKLHQFQPAAYMFGSAFIYSFSCSKIVSDYVKFQHETNMLSPIASSGKDTSNQSTNIPQYNLQICESDGKT
jgi:hypothetical protein